MKNRAKNFLRENGSKNRSNFEKQNFFFLEIQSKYLFACPPPSHPTKEIIWRGWKRCVDLEYASIWQASCRARHHPSVRVTNYLGVICCTRVICLKHGYKITREELGKLPTYYLSYQKHTSQRQMHTSVFVHIYKQCWEASRCAIHTTVHVKFGENLDGASRSVHHSSGLPPNTMATNIGCTGQTQS